MLAIRKHGRMQARWHCARQTIMDFPAIAADQCCMYGPSRQAALRSFSECSSVQREIEHAHVTNCRRLLRSINVAVSAVVATAAFPRIAVPLRGCQVGSWSRQAGRAALVHDWQGGRHQDDWSEGQVAWLRHLIDPDQAILQPLHCMFVVSGMLLLVKRQNNAT
jgi:hypothetical protein